MEEPETFYSKKEELPPTVKKLKPKRSDGKITMYCIGINKKEIIVGHNKYITSVQVKHNYPEFLSLHAELDFYYKAKKKKFIPSDIYIVGYRKAELKNTKPCIYCATVLKELRFKRIHFYENGELLSLTYTQFTKEVLKGLCKSYL